MGYTDNSRGNFRGIFLYILYNVPFPEVIDSLEEKSGHNIIYQTNTTCHLKGFLDVYMYEINIRIMVYHYSNINLFL